MSEGHVMQHREEGMLRHSVGRGHVMWCREGTRDTVSGRLGEGADRVLGDGNKTFYKRNY